MSVAAAVTAACSNDAGTLQAPKRGGPSDGPTTSTGAPNASGAVASAETLDLVQVLKTDGLTSRRVAVENDPVFTGPKEYEALALEEVLRRLSSFSQASSPQARADWALTFVALDRYRVTFPLSKIFERKAFLAFKEIGRPDKRDWGLIPAKKEAVTPAPFYLVWEGKNPDEFEYPVPYQIAFLELQKIDTAFAGAVPSESTSREGFRRYSFRCIMCHSINFVGGSSQRELNVPVSYAEQRAENDFVQSFVRAQANSPACPMVGRESDTTLRAIWRYLFDVSDQKICSTPADCRDKDPL